MTTHESTTGATGHPPVSSSEIVSLPAGMHLQPVCQAEFDTATRIISRWMYERPQVESLIFKREVKQANIILGDTANTRPPS